MSLMQKITDLAMTFGLPVRTACPLCVGTPRETLTYEAEQLAGHALASHNFEDVYDFVRGMAERYDEPDLVGGIDAAYDVLTELTTTYEEYVEPAPVDFDPDGHAAAQAVVFTWGWTCQRCRTYAPAMFSSEQEAREHRIRNHRCPA